MCLWAKFCFSCLVISSMAASCNDSQHCSYCNDTGHCITGCDPGYFDYKCTSVCSKNCRNKTCSTSNIGHANCTYGCVLGFQGTSCDTPCYSPGNSCTACPGGCYGGYCQLGSSCVSGCVDSYYGTDCKNTYNNDCGQEERYSTYLNSPLIAVSVFCVYVTCTVLVAIVLRCTHLTREGSREQEEDEYHHMQFHRRTSPDTAQHTNETFSELDDIDNGRVVIFL